MYGLRKADKRPNRVLLLSVPDCFTFPPANQLFALPFMSLDTIPPVSVTQDHLSVLEACKGSNNLYRGYLLERAGGDQVPLHRAADCSSASEKERPEASRSTDDAWEEVQFRKWSPAVSVEDESCFYSSTLPLPLPPEIPCFHGGSGKIAPSSCK